MTTKQLNAELNKALEIDHKRYQAEKQSLSPAELYYESRKITRAENIYSAMSVALDREMSNGTKAISDKAKEAMLNCAEDNLLESLVTFFDFNGGYHEYPDLDTTLRPLSKYPRYAKERLESLGIDKDKNNEKKESLRSEYLSATNVAWIERKSFFGGGYRNLETPEEYEFLHGRDYMHPESNIEPYETARKNTVSEASGIIYSYDAEKGEYIVTIPVMEDKTEETLSRDRWPKEAESSVYFSPAELAKRKHRAAAENVAYTAAGYTKAGRTSTVKASAESKDDEFVK